MGNCCGKSDGEYQPLATDPPPSYDTSSLEQPHPTQTGLAEKSPVARRKTAGAEYGSVSHPPPPKERGVRSNVEYSGKATRRLTHPLEENEETERKTALGFHEETRAKQVHREDGLTSGHATQGHGGFDPRPVSSPPFAKTQAGHVQAAAASSADQTQATSTTGLNHAKALSDQHQASSAAATLNPAKASASASSDQNQLTSAPGPSSTINEFQPTQTASTADQSEGQDDVTPAENGGPSRDKAAETKTSDGDATAQDVRQHDTEKSDVRKPDVTSEPGVSEPAAAKASALDSSASLSFGTGPRSGSVPKESDAEPPCVKTEAEVEPTSYEFVSYVAQPGSIPQNADDHQEQSFTSDPPSLESAGPNSLSFVILPESEQPASDVTIEPPPAAAATADNVKNDVTTDVTEEVTTDKDNVATNVKKEVTTDVKEDITTDSKEDVTTDVKEDVTTDDKEDVTTDDKEDVTTDVKKDFTTDAKEDVTTEVREDVTTAVKEGITTNVKEDVTTAVKKGVTINVKEDVPTAVKEGATTNVKEDVTTAVKEGVTTNVKEDVTTAVKEGVTTNVKEGVTTNVKSENKGDFASETPVTAK